MKKHILPSGIFFLILLILIKWYGNVEASSHFVPPYPKEDLSCLIEKDILSEDDYRTLFYQTGLGRTAIDSILSDKKDPQSVFLQYQNQFFKPVEVECSFNTPISKEERILDASTLLAPCQNADILVTTASHVLFYRNGHAALIVDSAKKQTLEAAVLGMDSSIQGIQKWSAYPNFVLLRLKNDDPSLCNAICQTALRQLMGIPYSLRADIMKQPADGTIFSGTHCSHLVNSAYLLNGIDLDSDGGVIVTPNDLLYSPHLEIVQIYGLDPASFDEFIFSL